VGTSTSALPIPGDRFSCAETNNYCQRTIDLAKLTERE
jgi:hypothetical protein